MKKHPLLKWVGMFTWLVTALAAINYGLKPFGWDFYETNLMRTTLSNMVDPLYYLVGICGVVSLIMYVMVLVSCCKKCGSESCSCM